MEKSRQNAEADVDKAANLVGDVVKAYLVPELARAWAKHGNLTSDHVRAMTILTEEVGEAAKEILAYTREYGNVVELDEFRTNAIKELTQVAATAIRMVVNLEEE